MKSWVTSSVKDKAIGAVLASALFATSAIAQDGPVKLGVLTDMSSLYADNGGQGSVVAAQMAVDDFKGKVLARDNSRRRSLQTDGGRKMSALEEAVISEGVARTARSRIDEIIAGRLACREFSNTPVPRQTIEQILRVARFAPSGANIQPWHVYVLAGAAKHGVSAALLKAHETCRDEHVSEYKYYASDLPEAYSNRRQEFGRLFYGSLGIARTDVEARSRQTAKNYAFFGAPVGLIVTIDRRLEVGSWLDLGMFVQNVMLAAAGRGLQSCPQETFAKYHGILRPLLSIPAEQMVVCGISIGRAKGETRERLMPRADVDEFASFAGFED